jgi:hypothetical protein
MPKRKQKNKDKFTAKIEIYRNGLLLYKDIISVKKMKRMECITGNYSINIEGTELIFGIGKKKDKKKK